MIAPRILVNEDYRRMENGDQKSQVRCEFAVSRKLLACGSLSALSKYLKLDDDAAI